MGYRAINLAFICGVLSFVASTVKGETVTPVPFANGGFETPFSTVGSLPTTYGTWTFDPARSVTAIGGVSPIEGQSMLQFLATNPGNLPLSVTTQADVWQLIGLAPLHSLITAGNAVMSVTARFNRVAGSMNSVFGIHIQAFHGDPSSFPSQVDTTFLARREVASITDSDPATWQPITVQLTLPSATDFIGIKLLAAENLVNNGVNEFDGHFADAVSVNLIAVPEPSTFCLFGTAVSAVLFAWGVRNNRLQLPVQRLP